MFRAFRGNFHYSLILFRTYVRYKIYRKIVLFLLGLAFSDDFVSIPREVWMLKVTMGYYYECFCQEHIIIAFNSLFFANKFNSVKSIM